MSVGFDLDDTAIPISDLTGYRVRSEDLDRLLPPAAAGGIGPMNASSALHKGTLSRRDSSGLFLAGGGGGGGIRGGGSGNAGRLFPLQDPGGKLEQLAESESVGGGGGGGAGCGLGVRASAADEAGTAEAFISGVYFPLLSVLMPKWMEQLAGNGDDADSSKTVLLVSGVGQPRNEAHRLEDNSTEVRAARTHARACWIFVCVGWCGVASSSVSCCACRMCKRFLGESSLPVWLGLYIRS